ncbi:hypothetical protein GDO86_006417 [Hymenochirus boettgeri]|uniref:Uncharacterized protein n=1 Tax=Hymenochirus boettgeri TaxID=247094 RepID=A0A8T2JDJ5_9PIPI|nr:hypothetical protein GDO86_006417 [Hymenochirus boettgeri]
MVIFDEVACVLILNLRGYISLYQCTQIYTVLSTSLVQKAILQIRNRQSAIQGLYNNKTTINKCNSYLQKKYGIPSVPYKKTFFHTKAFNSKCYSTTAIAKCNNNIHLNRIYASASRKYLPLKTNNNLMCGSSTIPEC